MNQDNAARPSVGKIVAGTVLALALGFLQPQILTIQLLTFNFCAASVIGVALYVWAGIIPAVVLAIAATANTFAGFGPLMGAALLPMTLLPPALIVWNACRKLPFFQQMQRGLIAFLGGTAATGAAGGAPIWRRHRRSDRRDHALGIRRSRHGVLEAHRTAPDGARSHRDVRGRSPKCSTTSSRSFRRITNVYLLANMLAGAAVSAIVAVFWGQLARWRGAAKRRRTALSVCTTGSCRRT